jgi:chaperonin GroEL
MGKQVQFDDDARRALWRGVDQLASAVRVTLGPRGRSVVIHRLEGAPTITRDGIAVAQEIELADRFANMGVHMLREVAMRTAAEAGDGTTTATVLAHRIVGDGLRAVASRHNPIAVKRGIDRATAAALAALRDSARPVDDERDLARIASVAANDHAMGERIAEALARVGRHGVVTVEDGRGLGTTLEVLEGLRFSGGYASPYFVNDPDDMEAAFDHPVVVLADQPGTRAQEVVPALEHAARLSRPLLLVCERVEGDALAVLVVNRLRGSAPSVAVRVTLPAARRRELFDDLAVVTGARLFAPELGASLERLEPAAFGRARHVTVTAEHTTLRQGGGRGEAVRAALVQLSRELGAATHEGDRERLRQRLARVSGGVAVIRVGAPTEVEMHALRARYEDALAATRAAVEEGIVPGGGVALLRAETAVHALDLSGAESVGREIVAAALAEPVRQIAVNAGEDGRVVLSRLRGERGAFGWNALNGHYGDLMAEGIVDPAKVARVALQQAAALGGLVLTTDAIVIDDGEDDAKSEGESAA